MTEIHTGSSSEAFEDRFRGSREEICRRLSVYLPLLEVACIRDIGAPVLDAGCGRGEWLEMLSERGYTATGIDTSEEAVSLGRRAGLDVAQADVFDDLRARATGSVAAFTAFHVVEHLDPSRLGELLAEVHRALAPGGVVVLETPNPENVTVGAASFYLDSDHARPIPPALLEFHASRAGFTESWIARVNGQALDAPLAPVSDDVPGALEVNAVVYAVNGLLFTAPDYSLVARKSSDGLPAVEAVDFERLFGPQPRSLAEHRRIAAAEAAHRLEAQNIELKARSAELERLVAAAESHASLAQDSANAVRADLEVISSSLSWRVTAPLRAVSAAARSMGLAPGTLSGGSAKRCAKLAVGYPMKWALSRPRLGPALDRQLVKVSAIDHKVRIAIHETTTARRAPNAPSHVDLPSDVAALPEPARAVFLDLKRRLEGHSE